MRKSAIQQPQKSQHGLPGPQRHVTAEEEQRLADLDGQIQELKAAAAARTDVPPEVLATYVNMSRGRKTTKRESLTIDDAIGVLTAERKALIDATKQKQTHEHTNKHNRRSNDSGIDNRTSLNLRFD